MLTFTVKLLQRKFALHGIKTKPALCGALHQCSMNGERHWLSAEAEGITTNHTYSFKNLDDNIFKGDIYYCSYFSQNTLYKKEFSEATC